MSVENIRVLCPGIDVNAVAVVQIDYANDNVGPATNQITSTALPVFVREKNVTRATSLTVIEEASDDTVTTSPDPPEE